MKIKKNLRNIMPMLFILACGAGSDEKKSFNETLGYTYKNNEQSLLWEITGKGLTQPSFLYGTIHLQDKRVFAYDTVVKRIFDTCKVYAMELNMDDIDAGSVAKTYLLEEGLDKILSPAQYALLDSLMLARTGSGIGMYNNMKPFFMAGVLIKAYEHQDMKFPLDLDFFRKAKKKKKGVTGIEKLEEQLAAVNSMTIEEQADMIIEGLKDWDKTKKLFDEMMDVYLKQDIAQLSELMKDTALPKTFETALLTDRNKVMAQRMDSIIQLNPTFNAIGAGHLYGDKGVITLMRKRGYTLKPVAFKFE